MLKYGRGLGREIFEAARRGKIRQPFNVDDCRQFSFSKGWSVPEKYIRVVLANSERNRDHSDNYKDYFIRVSEGQYRINPKL